MQHATLAGREAACSTSDGRGLFERESALLHFRQNPIKGGHKPVQIGTVPRYGSRYACAVRMTELTLQSLLAVPCPTCGVDAGKDCVLHEGGLRSDPHIDRKLDAAEAIEAKRTPNPD